MAKKIFYIQPVDLSTMVVEADTAEVVDSGVAFYNDGVDDDEFVFFAPHINTKYITRKDCSFVKGKRDL